jgi:hypothetical protein
MTHLYISQNWHSAFEKFMIMSEEVPRSWHVCPPPLTCPVPGAELVSLGLGEKEPQTVSRGVSCDWGRADVRVVRVARRTMGVWSRCMVVGCKS